MLNESSPASSPVDVGLPDKREANTKEPSSAIDVALKDRKFVDSLAGKIKTLSR